MAPSATNALPASPTSSIVCRMRRILGFSGLRRSLKKLRVDTRLWLAFFADFTLELRDCTGPAHLHIFLGAPDGFRQRFASENFLHFRELFKNVPRFQQQLPLLR